MKRAVVLPIAAVLLSACSDSPTQPESATPVTLAPEAPSLSVSSGAGSPLDFAADLDAINTRILPSLSDQTAAAELRGDFDRLSAALTAGDRTAAAAAIASVRESLTADIGAPGDVGVLELVIDNIARAL